MNNQISEVAQTIHQQIRQSHIRNEPYLDFFKAVKSSQLVTLEDGLQFRVKGDKFSSKVVIKLNVMDTYDIEFWNISMEPFVCEKVDEIKDIYNTELLETLWNRIVIV